MKHSASFWRFVMRARLVEDMGDFNKDAIDFVEASGRRMSRLKWQAFWRRTRKRCKR